MFERSLRSEDGAVAVITAIVLVVLIGSAALAIDIGSIRTERRAVVGTADATALAVAKYLSDSSQTPGCDFDYAYDTVAQGIISDDRPDAWPPTAVTLVVNTLSYDLTDATQRAGLTTLYASGCPEQAQVTVELEVTEDLEFAPVFGITESHITAATTAEFGELSGGYLPSAFCASNEPIPTAVEQVDTYDTSYPSNGQSVPLHFEIGGSSGTANNCGVTPGNLGWIDCDGDNLPGGGNDVPTWITDGCEVTFVYEPPGLVPLAYEVEFPEGTWTTIPDPTDPTVPARGLPLAHTQGNQCGAGAQYAGWCDVITGSIGAQERRALAALADRDRSVLLYDHADCGNDSGSVGDRGYFESCRTTSSSQVEYRLTQYTTIHIDAVCYENPGNNPATCVGDYTPHDGSGLAGPGNSTRTGPDYSSFDVNNASGFVLWVTFQEFASAPLDIGDPTGAVGAARGIVMCADEGVSTCG